jgi:hypothetical protein
MIITKTKTLDSVQNKGQRQVIVEVLSKLSAPISAEELTKKVVATGRYNGKGTKAHVNKWAMEKAGGDLGSVKYHLKALAKEKRVTLADGVVAEKRTRKPKAEKPAEQAPPAEQPAEQVAA